MKKKLLIFGGSGYVGSLIIHNLQKKYNIINYDIDFFGSKHLDKKKIKHIKGDVRDIKKINQVLNHYNPEYIIHLACISNDPTYLLDEKLSKDINYTSFQKLVKLLENHKVKKFIFASTSSVYGVSAKKNVRENHPFKPITAYNKYKGKCEKVLLKRKNQDMKVCIIRPATVCGVSPKMRFDLTVNILTNFALRKNYIKVFGGQQTRPNIHIDDMVRLYSKLLSINLNHINNECFNAGFENLSISSIAHKVANIVQKIKKREIKIYYEKTNDKRSYRVNSDKIKKKIGFYPKKNVSIAIKDICNYLKKNKNLKTFSKKYYNIKILSKK